MKRFLFVAFAISILGLIGCQPQKPATPYLDGETTAFPARYESRVGSTFKVMSWNVENFIDAHDNPYINNRWENAAEGPKEEKMALFVEAVKEANADVVVLQEFEEVPYLIQIARDNFDSLGYRFFADAESPTWYQNVVVMSKVPLGMMHSYGNVTTPFTFEEDGETKTQTQSRINTRMWTVDVWVTENYSFQLTGLHLKAGRGPRNEAMRLAQVKLLKAQFERFWLTNPNENMLVVGDLNCTPSSTEFQTLIDGGSPVTFTDPLPADMFSHPADSVFWRIDHVLPNENMLPELVSGSAKVEYFFSPDSMRKISDHLPLVAEFKVTD